jgi:hypothetical protein
MSASTEVEEPADGAAGFREGAPAPSRRMEVLLAVGALVLMAVLLVLVSQIELRREAGPGQIDARFWPTVIGWTGVAVAVWRLVVTLTSPPDDREGLEQVQVGGPVRLLLTLGAAVAFVAVWNLRSVVALGYEFQVFPFAAVVLLVGLTWVYGGRGWKALVLFPVATTALIYVLFHTLLRIPL